MATHTSQSQQGSPGPDRHAGRKSVPYSDALKAGMWVAIIVFVLSAIMTRGRQFAEQGLSAVLELGLPLLYAAIAFIAFSGIALLMNWVVSRKDSQESIDGPVLD
ncbi:hypothetical protein [Brevibacterium album]|uniref:hypothetical protein n=1 Tax=Brevibacterium album TaxID=417948 RepID=UPI00048D8B9B|nr:hypothetical protein [Brevibacterium album]